MATNALFGYVNMLLKVVKDLDPSHLAVVMDSIAPTFRKELYPPYKANRPPTPEDLKEQFPYVEPLTEALGIPTVRAETFEADDVIATLAVRGRNAGMDVTIVSSDKDLMQLVGDGVVMFDTMKDRKFDSDAVVEKFGVPPQQMVDLQAIMGDSSDNVPGVKGLGPKGAAKLLLAFGSLDEVFARVDEVTPPRAQNLLKEHREAALVSRELVTLRTDAPVAAGLDSLVHGEKKVEKLRELFTFLGFKGFLKQLLPGSQEAPAEPASDVDAGAGAVAAAPRMPEVKVVLTEQDLDAMISHIARVGSVSLDTETTSVQPMAARLVGISACPEPSGVYYLPLTHKGEGADRQLPTELVREKLSKVLEDSSVGKVGQNFKYDMVVLQNHGFSVAGLSFDTMLASYLLDPGRQSHSLDNLAAEFLGLKLISYKEVTTRGGMQLRFDRVPLAEAARYAGEDAWATLELARRLEPGIVEAGLESLLVDVELPVSEALADMERTGIAIDSELLQKLSGEFGSRLAAVERDIYEIAGVPFNINSPKQLGEVLFERHNLPRKRKTKTGYSTDVRVLEELSAVHPLPRKILDYRSMAKLKSTYIDVLPTLVNSKTGRIHTSFNQAVTATGRLSSSDPNLQNIPIRGEEGKRIREAFVPGEGKKFLAADYSQVELRILAHLAEDPVLIRAFNKGEDIHSRTAAEIFRVLPGMVSPDMRRVAKTINFGIVYGMSAYRLSREQKIPLNQAKTFIETYFQRYRGIKEFLEKAVAFGEEHGYVETLLKRRRYLPDLKARNKQVRAMAERMAINTPVQGGAADLVKLAMVKLHRRLANDGLPAKLVLQVHDELVVEAAPEAAEHVAEVVTEVMENVWQLSVPLKVDVGVGDNWAEVHG